MVLFGRLFFVFAPAVVTACAMSAPASSSPSSPVETGPLGVGIRTACPKLDSQLDQLTRAADPDAFAATAGLNVRNGAVLVVVELQAGASLTDLRGSTIEQRNGDLLQMRAPISRLCELAADQNVRLVRQPARPVPQ